MARVHRQVRGLDRAAAYFDAGLTAEGSRRLYATYLDRARLEEDAELFGLPLWSEAFDEVLAEVMARFARSVTRSWAA